MRVAGSLLSHGVTETAEVQARARVAYIISTVISLSICGKPQLLPMVFNGNVQDYMRVKGIK